MIVISVVLVIVAAVTLVVGLFFTADSNDLSLIYVSIGSCLLAGLFLLLAVLRQRPSRRPVVESGGEGQPATWGTAQSWYEQRRATAPATAVLEREEPARQPAARPGGPLARPGGSFTGRQDEQEPVAPADASEWTADAGAAPTGEATEEPEAPAAEPAAEAAAVTPLRRRAGAKKAGPRKTARRTTRRAAVPDEAAAQPAGADAAPAEAQAAAEPVDTAPAAAEAAAREAAEPAPAEARASAEPLAEQRPRGAARRARGKKTAAAAAPDEVVAFSEALSGISGLGPARSADLAAHFGTVEALRQADVEQLAQVPGISQTLARRIRARLDEQQPAPAAPTARKAAAKKASARKTAAKRAPASKAATGAATARRGAARKAPVGDRQAARFQAALSGVSGLGPARIADLAGRFGTLRRLQAASTQELVAVPGISETLARRIQQALQR